MRFTGIKGFIRSEGGSALPLVALGIFMLIGAVGAAIDMGRVQIVQSRLQSALDAAGLAVGSEINGPANINTELNKYFYANFPANYVGTTITVLTVTPNADNSVLALAAQGKVNTTFMQIFGINSVTVSATSQITRQSTGMELVLVLDNTGSMNCDVTNPYASCTGGASSKIAGLKSATATLLSILYGSTNDTISNLWVGVVPFSQTVNIGTSHAGWLDSTYDTTLNFGPVANTASRSCSAYGAINGIYATGPTCTYTIPGATATLPLFGQINWQGCVESRSNGTASPQYDVTDDPPSVKPFRQYLWPKDSTNFWYSTSTTQQCTGGCIRGHNTTGTCTTTYPACCSPYAEGCVNPPSCGLPPTTYSCQVYVCDQQGGPQVCNPTGLTAIYNYSYASSLGTNRGPNVYCPQPVLPMVAEKSTVMSTINSLVAGGSTEIDLGLAWAYRILSPRWRGLWGGEMDTNNLPLDYNTPLMNKVVILMTDGMNSVDTTSYTAYGYLSANQLGTKTNITVADATLDTRTLAVCTSLKNNGVIIYTIGFGSTDDDNPNNPTSVNGPLLKACATDASHYFLTPSNAELTAAFQQIGDSLANLRVSH